MIAPLDVCAETEAPPLLGGRYRLDGVIAAGGSATVHRALDVRLGRAVAIKRPHAIEAHDRIRCEAAILARCAHPGIVACLDAGEDETGAPYVALQRVDGVNLVQHVAVAVPSRAVARAWAREVARAVAHLHARGIVHGDLKPQHVVIDRDGHAVIVDFDRAHLNWGGDGVGEALASGVEAYAAPGVRAGAPTSVASDRFALRAVMWWLLRQSQPEPV